MSGLAMTLIILALAAIALVTWALVQKAELDASAAREQAWLPEELRDADLLLAEPKPLYFDGEVSLVAKPDRAYKKRDGRIKLVELKTRPRHVVYDEDVIEMSVQRVVLHGRKMGEVEREGLVVTQLRDSGERRVHRVQLMDSDTTMNLAKRYLSIRAGTTVASKTSVEGKCRRCAHKVDCWAT